MKSKMLFSVLGTLAAAQLSITIAVAQTPPPLQLDHGQTPLEYSTQETGVFPIHDVRKCSLVALTKKINLPNSICGNQNIRIGTRQIYAAQLNQGLITTVQKAFQLFESRFDTELKAKNICVGIYNFGVLNAFSHPEGYLLFDPSLMNHFLTEFADRSMLSLDTAVYHELAHQFEFWYGDAFINDATYKRSELSADCVAAYLNAAIYRNRFGEENWSLSKRGILKAVESLGDFQYEDQNHHGTPAERYRAAELGIEIAESRLSTFMNSRQVIQACQGQIASKL